MKYGGMKQCYFTRKDRYFLRIMAMSLMATLAAGCSSDMTTASLAPPPPKFDANVAREQITKLSIESVIGAGQGLGTQGVSGAPAPAAVSVALQVEARPKGCRVQDRFDKKALLAYEWGGRSRLGLDVDGLSYDSYEVEQVKIEYRLRFQEYKTTKERCRYNSNWQGILGTGYNELFIRENDTIWQELDILENDVEDSWDTIFH